ncbi:MULTISPECIES: hypothetical protein [Halorussus]|uniref:hypothetical protein n=1 Tax=Halorussus TaxID=1070314 RepID=UPI000E2109D1|nr:MULTISPECIES: hypothetical protein [Halorussus]NHN61257.1 hypothetical protein [Halorussus sp. JP-T4]
MTDRSARRAARSTRRGFLALAGAASLAGCGLPDPQKVLHGEPPKVDRAALAEIPSTDPPSVPETVPVEIRRTYLDDGIARARDLLASVPAPFEEEEIPNGAIREDLARKHERARTAVESVDEAASPLGAMETVRDARGEARAVAAGWKAIDADLTRADVRESGRSLFDAADRFRSRWSYDGADPIRAVVVHAEIETHLDAAVNRAERVVAGERSGRENPVAVGELAGDIELARASLDDAGHLYDRLTATADGSRSLRAGFIAAVETLGSLVGPRRGELPDGDPTEPSSFVSRDVDGTPAGEAIRRLATDLEHDDAVDRARTADEYASAVLAAHGILVRIRALNALLRRVEAGEHVIVESAADARGIRADAVAALEKGLRKDDYRHLNRRVIGNAAGHITYADRDLSRYDGDGTVSVTAVADELGEYVMAGALARATPPTSARVAGVVRRSVRQSP